MIVKANVAKLYILVQGRKVWLSNTLVYGSQPRFWECTDEQCESCGQNLTESATCEYISNTVKCKCTAEYKIHTHKL